MGEGVVGKLAHEEFGTADATVVEGDAVGSFLRVNGEVRGSGIERDLVGGLGVVVVIEGFTAIIDSLAKRGLKGFDGHILLYVPGSGDVGDVIEEEVVALLGETERLLEHAGGGRG